MEKRMKVKIVKPGEFIPKGGVVGVDFETFYSGDYSASDMGNFAYVRDERFKAWAVSVSDGETVCVCRPEEFPWARINGLEWVSHHREFDRAVWERLRAEGGVGGTGTGDLSRQDAKTQRYGYGPRAWRCSAAACAFLQYPRDLQGACREILGVEIDKSRRDAFKGLRGEAETLPGFDDLGVDEAAYAASDAVMCLAVWRAIGGRWPEHERELFEATCEMGATGLCIDWAMVEKARAALKKTVRELVDSVPWYPTLSGPKFEQACRDVQVTPPASMAKGDENFQLWLNMHEGKPIAKWASAMSAVRRCGRLVSVLEGMEARRMDNNRMAFELKYFGATPGRWSGGGGLNLQNMNRKETEGLDLRKCIKAPLGQVLGVGDYSQIEARVLLFLAGDTEALALLAQHPEWDMYELHARATMGFKGEESLQEYCDRTGSNLRQYAKARVLGLGFRCGAETFIRVAKSMAGLVIGIEESRKAVNDYRYQNPKVVALWEELERQAWECFEKGVDYVLPFPCTSFDPRCGRYLFYRDLQVVQNGKRKELSAIVCGERVPLHGGILAENWTQGAARDLMASAWLRCRTAGYRPILTVHDELAFELPEASAQEHLKKIVAIMERPAPWAPGLPLKVGAKLMSRYGK